MSPNANNSDASRAVLGVDIGGANLKYATTDNVCFERTFPMWTQHERLADQLVDDIQRFDSIDSLAVTMTGELADCFPSRADGVREITQQVVDCTRRLSIRSVRFYGTDGSFYESGDTTANWERIAASNWHALASFVASQIAPNGLLVDIGSTTTDIIAIHQGRVMTDAATDHQRLANQALVYVGCRRTPVCSLLNRVAFRGEDVMVMKEFFATVDDARLIRRTQPEDPDDRDTANSQPRDWPSAKIRLARMIGLDHNQISDAEAIELSNQVIDAARQPIARAIHTWWSRLREHCDADPVLVLSGHGQDLVAIPADANVIDLREHMSAEVSRVAPAWAVAFLMKQQSNTHHAHSVSEQLG